MNFNIFIILTCIAFSNCVTAQTDRIFKSSFEYIFKLNDTGITWAGEYTSDNNVDCSSTTITSPQDCNQGLDFINNDDSDGHAGFSFTKLDASGNPLKDQSVTYDLTPWACVKDNVTGLVWEVKTTTSGIHNKDNTYQWGGLSAMGRDHPNSKGTYYDDWNTLVQGSNDGTLCGFDNWRVPTVVELSSIANKGTLDPSIDTNYFPNTESSWYWSSAPFVDFVNFAWLVYFSDGYDGSFGRSNNLRVRLVCYGQ